jgi:Protein of unknown function (DUF1329)
MRRVWWGCLVAGALVLLAGAGRAADGPWTLDATTWERGKDLVPEPVLRRVKAGEYRFPVVPADPARFRDNYSRAFWDASAKNAGKYDLEPKTCGLREVATGKVPEFYFGYPFPTITRDDPRAGCKIAWNFTAAGYMAGGTGASFYLTGLDTHGAYRTVRTRLQATAYVGRHGGRIANPERVAVKATTIALEPPDVEGVSTLTVRHLDWDKPDDMWAFVPQTRRARHISSATRSEPVAGMDIFADDINCYAGKVETYQWTLVGEGTVLAPVVASPYALPQQQVSPTRWTVDTPALPAQFEDGAGKAAPWLITGGLAFVPRPVWIVEGESSDPYYNFGKVVMYFDKEMYRIYWKVVNNRAGEYFYNAMCGYTFGITADHQRSSVMPTLVVGVNDKTNRAAIGGRPRDQFIEEAFDPAEFTLKAITRSND